MEIDSSREPLGSCPSAIDRRTVLKTAFLGAGALVADRLFTGSLAYAAGGPTHMPGPPLWVAERGNAKVFLFGQMTVRTHSPWLSSGIQQAFEASTELWVENPEFTPPLPPPPGTPMKQDPPKGPKLVEVAGGGDMKRMRALLGRSGMAVNSLDAVALSDAYPAVSAVADRAFDVDFTALPERMLKARAKAAGKPVHSEWTSVEEIAHFMTDLPDDLERKIQLQLVRKTLDEAEDIDAAERRLEQWLNGELAGWEAFDRRLQRKCPELYRHVGTGRNKAWVPRIESAMARTQTAFVCVGLLHVLGPESIQAQLKRSGIGVKRV